MESETFFLPGFILEDEDNNDDASAAEQQHAVVVGERQLNQEPDGLPDLPIGSATNPWKRQEAAGHGIAATDLSLPGLRPSSRIIFDDEDVPVVAPGTTQSTACPAHKITTSIVPPAESSRESPLDIISTLLSSGIGMDRQATANSLEVVLPKAPPGFENVAPSSLPTTPRGQLLDLHSTAPTTAPVGNVFDSETSEWDTGVVDDWDLLVPSMFVDPEHPNCETGEFLMTPHLEAASHTKLADDMLNTSQTAHDKMNTLAPQPKKSWVSVATAVESAHQPSIRSIAYESPTDVVQTTAHTFKPVIATSPYPNHDYGFYTRTGTRIAKTAEAEALVTNRPSEALDSDSRHSKTLSSDCSRRSRKQNFDSKKVGSGGSSRHGLKSDNDSQLHFEPRNNVTNQESPIKTEGERQGTGTKSTKKKQSFKGGGDAAESSSHSSSLTDAESREEFRPSVHHSDQTHVKDQRPKPIQLQFSLGTSCTQGLGSWFAVAGRIFSDIVLPACSSVGMVFAFLAKALIIAALMLANTFKYATAEVEQSENGSFFCYLVFYVAPNGCDVLMSLFSLPHFTPHVLSSVALYLLATGGSKRKYRSKTTADRQAEFVCGTILQSCRYSIPFDLILEGFAQPNMRIMMLDVPSRLLLAYILSLLRANLILSPLAWLCCSFQVVMAAHLPYNKLTECLLLLIGLASIRLSSSIAHAMEGTSVKEA